MKKLTIILTILTGLIILIGTNAIAVQAADCPGESDPTQYDCQDGCERLGHCVNNKRCILVPPNRVYPGGTACGSSVIGGVQAPAGVSEYNIQNGVIEGKIGILAFVSRLLRIFTIISGLLIMANFVISGIEFISSAGNTEVMGKVNKRLTYSLIGIAIIVSAYTIAGVISLIFFGDAGFILNPNIEQYGALAP